jgi:anti-sigma B factor antagonist
MHFTLSTQTRPPEAVITARGELDVFTSLELRQRLEAAVALGCRQVVLDLGGISFADASALQVLVRFHRDLAEVHGSLRIVAMSAPMQRLCRITGLDNTFGLDRTVLC